MGCDTESFQAKPFFFMKVNRLMQTSQKVCIWENQENNHFVLMMPYCTWFAKEDYNCTNFLDDFGGMEAFQYLGKILKDLGFIGKTEQGLFSCSINGVFLQILFDSVQMTMSVTAECFLEIRQLLSNWLSGVSTTRKQLESLIGKLLFIATCILHSKLFVAWCSKGVDMT